jgi:hypothetical protein
VSADARALHHSTVAVHQNLIDKHAFSAKCASVLRSVLKLRAARNARRRCID